MGEAMILVVMASGFQWVATDYWRSEEIKICDYKDKSDFRLIRLSFRTDLLVKAYDVDKNIILIRKLGFIYLVVLSFYVWAYLVLFSKSKDIK